jgi:DNA-binding NtrC family response regulator
MIQLLHLDDDPLFLFRCSQAFRNAASVAHVHYHTTHTAEEFFQTLKSLKPHAILLDLSFGGAALQGLVVLAQVRAMGCMTPVIMMSALGSSEIILQCVRAGATDFLSKGLDEGELTFRIGRILNTLNPSTDTSSTAANLPVHITGRCLREIQTRLQRVIRSPIRSVLVTGESGTGKEMVAEILRSLLPAGTPFIAVNCAALSSHLVESEIFGHEKGAFTGATQSKIGLYEAADGGWIFLDEVARLSPQAQAALLRALENGEVRPVGAHRTKKVQVRVLAATNEPLESLADKGDFRADLLSRLRGYEISLPPLRARSTVERQEIIEALVERLNATLGLEDKDFRLTQSCLTVLRDLPWKQGNIREVWQTLQSMSVDAVDGVLSLELIPARLINKKSEDRDASDATLSSPPTADAVISQESQRPSGGNDLKSAADCRSMTIPEGFPVHFENLVDQLFEQLWSDIRASTGDSNPSQRTVAQMLNITRHEASQRLARLGRSQESQ